MPNAWLTPDEIPATLICYRVTIPDSVTFDAVFLGALLLLTLPENWEQSGSVTPEEAAAAFESVFDSVTVVDCE